MRNLTVIGYRVPLGPYVSIHTVPSMTLIEYIVQFGSCMGMWFGLSIISLNPLELKILRKGTGEESTKSSIRRLFLRIPRNRVVDDAQQIQFNTVGKHKRCKFIDDLKNQLTRRGR